MTQTPQNTNVVRYQPNQPVGSVPTLKSLLGQMSDSLRQVLPRHVTPERVAKLMLVAANRNPKILECTGTSVMETVGRAAELGLDLSGTLGECYPVPYWTKAGMVCQLIIGYRGLAKLARQSGEIARMEAEVVSSHDRFVYRKGAKFALEFEPALADRGEPIGAYSLVEFKDGSIQSEFMAVADINVIRDRSKSSHDRQGNLCGPWASDWGEMARKTVFRRLAKWLPLSAEKFVEAVEHDNDDFPDVREVTVQPGDPTAGNRRLLDKLTAPAPATEQEQAAEPESEPAPEPGSFESDEPVVTTTTETKE